MAEEQRKSLCLRCVDISSWAPQGLLPPLLIPAHSFLDFFLRPSISSPNDRLKLLERVLSSVSLIITENVSRHLKGRRPPTSSPDPTAIFDHPPPVARQGGLRRPR